MPAVGTFGARLALVRHTMGWNQKEAALACGIPPANWRQWEVMGSLPRNVVDVCGQIAQHTAVDSMWLLTGTMSTTASEVEGFGALQDWAEHAGITLDWAEGMRKAPNLARGSGLIVHPLGLEPRTHCYSEGHVAEVVSIDSARSLRSWGGEAA